MADVKLLKYDGTEQQYPGVERVQLATVGGGTAIFSYGEAVEGIEISPDFSSGDMTVDAPAGTLVKSAVIKRPDTLIPENIPVGTNIAGVDGGMVIPDKVNTEITLDFSDGAMEVVPDAGTVFEKVTIPVPEGLVPENIAKDATVAGITGTHSGGGGLVLDNFLKYFLYNINMEENTITLYKIFYDLLYADTGSYDIEIPGEISGMSVIINSNGA